MHDTVQLKKCCEGDEFISRTFLDVFAADTIPQHLPVPCCFICNTDPIDLPGTHWVAVMRRENGQDLFIDSYGMRPTDYRPMLWRRFANFEHSTYDLQQVISTVCGDWCLYFLRVLNRNTELSLAEVVRQFDVNDDAGNDAIIMNAIHGLYPRILNVEGHPMTGKIQGCKSREN